MDEKDKKILYSLDRDARIAYSEIGKSARMSQETVRYRINRLVEQGVIDRFVAVINSTLLGFSHYQLLLKLQNVDEKKRAEIVGFFEKHPSVNWIGNLEGSYDVAVIIAVRTHHDLQRLFDDFQKYSTFIMKKVISIIVRSEFLSREYLKGAPQRHIKSIGLRKDDATKKNDNNQVDLDDVDRNICHFLAKDARMSSVEIAAKIGISPDAIIKRLRRLERDSIIAGYTIIMRQSNISQTHHKILLFLNNVSGERARALLSFARANGRVIAIVHTLAEWTYEIDVEVEDISQMKSFTMDLTNNFSDIIRDYELLQIADMPKYTFCPSTL